MQDTEPRHLTHRVEYDENAIGSIILWIIYYQECVKYICENWICFVNLFSEILYYLIEYYPTPF